MPEVQELGTDVYTISFDATEAAWFDRHAERWGLSKSQAVADLLSSAVATIGAKKRSENVDELFADGADDTNVAVTIGWPTEGPFASVSDEDRFFVASWLSCTLKEALLIVNYKHIGKAT